jgi:hypothetical protein
MAVNGLKTQRSLLLRRVKSPTIDTVHSIAKALECTVSDLIGERDIDGLFIEDKTGHILDWRLYVDTLVKVGLLLGKNNVETDKNKIYELIEEVYQYSLRTSKQSMDKAFAEWALDKLLSRK